MSIEIELGVTGGEEDGVDNTNIDNALLYTQPQEVAYAYEELSKVSPHFTIAASFGNVHGVYKPGNVTLTPKILDNSQKYIEEKFKTLPKPVQHTHIVEVLQEATLQEKVIVMMLYTLGLRISELSGLRVEDVNGAWVRVMGKGGKQRDVPLLSTTKTVLEEYLQTFTPKRFVFEKNGERLSENSLRYTINKLFAKRGLKVTPHQLRHSYATALLNGGAPIVDVSELLGHSSMATTQIYTKLGSALKKQNYQKAHPLCGVSK
jgi:site-specific recombinase XerD